jgi:hypothetical protein
VAIGLCLNVFSAAGAGRPYEEFGDYKVYFSVFNSSFIKADIARLHNITRAKDQALINIAVVKNKNKESLSGGMSAQITGTASNLMQQQRTLNFVEIKEGDAVYYLAPLRFTNEEVINFKINVKANNRQSHTLKFTKTLYVENE